MYLLIFPLLGLIFLYWTNPVLVLTVWNRILARVKGNSLKINRFLKYLEIHYNVDGFDKTLYIPVNLDQAFLASQCRITIFRRNGKEIPMSQDSDIPILVTPNDLEAEYIEIFNIFTGASKRYFNHERIEYIY